MGHTDVVNVDPTKWTFPPFCATRDGGYVYGRGTVDDKDNVAAALMVMLQLKRQNVPLDRDVIFLAEAGEEGTHAVSASSSWSTSTSPQIDAEYCFAEGGGVTRIGRPGDSSRSVQTLEKIPRAIELTARGAAGHGSVPLQTNAVVHLAEAVGAQSPTWQPPIRLNETTGAYFKRLATMSTPEEAERYRDVLTPIRRSRGRADEYFLRATSRATASMLRTSVSPTSSPAATASTSSRPRPRRRSTCALLPDEDPAKFLEQVQARSSTIPTSRCAAPRATPGPARRRRGSTPKRSRRSKRNVTKHYNAVDAADDEHRRDRHGVPAREGHAVLRHRPGHRHRGRPEGLRRAQRPGAHPRIVELHTFVKFHWDIVVEVAGRPLKSPAGAGSTPPRASEYALPCSDASSRSRGPRPIGAAGCRKNRSLPYDLVIANGRVMDPESGLDAVRHVGMRGGTIAALSETPLAGTRVIDATGLVVAPGFIDLHEHGQAGGVVPDDGARRRHLRVRARGRHGRRRGLVRGARARADRQLRRVDRPHPGAHEGARRPGHGPAAGRHRRQRHRDRSADGGDGGAAAQGPGARAPWPWDSAARTRRARRWPRSSACSASRPRAARRRTSTCGAALAGLHETIAAAKAAQAPLHIVHVNSCAGDDIDGFLAAIKAARAAGRT